MVAELSCSTGAEVPRREGDDGRHTRRSMCV